MGSRVMGAEFRSSLQPRCATLRHLLHRSLRRAIRPLLIPPLLPESARCELGFQCEQGWGHLLQVCRDVS